MAMPDDEVLDRAVGAVRFVIPDARLCLQSAILLIRVLDVVAKGHGLVVRLGSLRVIPERTNHPLGAIFFDPRDAEPGLDGTLPPDTPFHAWIESRDEVLIDHSILPTLEEDGYEVDAGSYISFEGRTTVLGGLIFQYEVVPELQIIGVAQSEQHLQRAVRLALEGPSPRSVPLGPNLIDIRWKRR